MPVVLYFACSCFIAIHGARLLAPDYTPVISDVSYHLFAVLSNRYRHGTDTQTGDRDIRGP